MLKKFSKYRINMNNNYLSALFIIGSITLASCGGGANKQGAPGMGGAPQVTAFEVTQEEVNVSDSYPGTIVALNQTELRAEVNGYITAILAADGSQVTKGQKLYEIDKIRYASAQQQAQANLEIAKSNLMKVQTDVKRYQQLAEQDAIAKQTLDYALTDLANAKAQVASAEAALTSANTDLERSVIRAPFTGTIGISQVRLGALVSAGNTLLNTISSTDPIGVDIPVNEKDIPRFVALQKSAPDSTFKLVLPDQTPYPSAGKLTTIDRAINPQTGTLTARVVFPNPDNVLRAGMNTNVLVATHDTGEQLVIPSKAIIQQLSANMVFVIADSNKVQQRTIQVGAIVDDKIIVRGGLKLGEKIVVDGAQNLRDGMAVQIAGQPAEQKAQQTTTK